VITSALLWESDVAIGLSSFGDAREQPMTSVRWAGSWSLFVAISVLAAFTPYLGVRAGAAPRTSVTPIAVTRWLPRPDDDATSRYRQVDTPWVCTPFAPGQTG
jgi:hypothetical protein